MVSLSEVTMLVLSVAVAGLYVFKPVLDFLHGIFPCNRVLVSDALLLTLWTTYLMGVILVFLKVTPAPATLVSPAAMQRFAGLPSAMACSLLLLLAMSLMAPRFLTGGW